MAVCVSVLPSSPIVDCCDHAGEIADLRAAVATLQQQVKNLIRRGPTVVDDPAQPSLDEDGRLPASRTAQRPAVRSESGLPYADHGSSEPAKIELFRSLFMGRDDVYAYRWENPATEEKGWAPKRRTSAGRHGDDFVPLDDQVVAEHLRDNPQTVGLYVMLADSTCRLLACDFDDATWQLDAAAYAQVAAAAGVPAAVEVSRSGEGAHVWTFFSEPVPAADARALGAALLREALAVRGELGLESYDRLFPVQDFMPKRGFGNLIALPLQGRCRKQQHTTVFVDPQTWQPLPDQFAFLSTVRRMTRREVLDAVEQLEPATVGPAVRLRRSPLAGEPAPPKVVKAELAGMLAIRRAGLPPGLLASLKHLASLHNPQFYEKQRMGFSVWNTPRFLRCYTETLEHLYLPRGVLEEAQALVGEAGSHLEITDVRPQPGQLGVSFTGTPRDAAQKHAIDVMRRHDLGVLVAPPGAGKTVIGCALIAHHGTPTLVLVDRAPLLRQWQQRLHAFLGLTMDQIGQIGAGKARRTGVVDLAMLQTLARHEDPASMLDGYGLVVVDECHHVAADTFETAIRTIPARRWLGLTATPRRADHREQIMLMQCGPIRHRVTTGADLVKSLRIHPTESTLRDDIDTEVPGLLSSIVLPALVADEDRNTQICRDVAASIAEGRNCLVLTGRTSHVGVLVQALRSLGLNPVTLHGRLTPAERVAALDALANPDGGVPLLVVATDRYIGEGFDCPDLDTVFLTFPISSETPLTQYVGRILREHPGKTDAIVHDYADTRIPMLARMHGKRLTTYRRLGFTTGPAPLRLQLTTPPPTPILTNEPASNVGVSPTAAQVRAWARGAGLDVSARGRPRPEVWTAYRQAHPDGNDA